MLVLLSLLRQIDIELQTFSIRLIVIVVIKRLQINGYSIKCTILLTGEITPKSSTEKESTPLVIPV